MCPERAKVFIVDDQESCVDVLSEFLAMEGHTVVSTANSVKSALDAIANLTDVDVALIDGNLSRFSMGGHDGARVAAEFRKKFPGKPLFSISSDSQSWSDDPSLSRRDGSGEIARRVTRA